VSRETLIQNRNSANRPIRKDQILAETGRYLPPLDEKASVRWAAAYRSGIPTVLKTFWIVGDRQAQVCPDDPTSSSSAGLSLKSASNDDHWAEVPDHPVDDWKAEVANDETRLGYRAWVAARADAA